MATWTNLEERRLREIWPASGAELVAAIPRHSHMAIAMRAFQLGLRARRKTVPASCLVLRALVERRKMLGLSISEVARRMEVNASNLSKAEQGKNHPRLATLKHWAAVLGGRIEFVVNE